MLRGKIEAAFGNWTAAIDDLKTASDTQVTDGDAQLALASALEHIGNKDGALATYLKAASAPYQTNPKASEAFTLLFVEEHKGTAIAAETKILAEVGR